MHTALCFFPVQLQIGNVCFVIPPMRSGQTDIVAEELEDVVQDLNGGPVSSCLCPRYTRFIISPNTLLNSSGLNIYWKNL